MLSGWLSQCSPALLSFSAIITHFNPTQPWRQSSARPLSAGFRMSGVFVQSSCTDTCMCTKAVTTFCCCQSWRLSFPERSPLAHCGCLIFINSEWLLFSPMFTVFEYRFRICKRPGKIYGLVTQKGCCLMSLEAVLHLASHNNRHTTRPYSQTAIAAFTTPEGWWHMGFMDPINRRRNGWGLWFCKCERINRMLITEVQL